MSSVKELLRGDVIDGSGTANYIPKFIDTNTIGNSAIYESSGNIGIGTSSPTQQLQVGDGSTSEYIRVFGALADSYFGSDATGTFLGNNSSAPIYFNTNSAERLRIDASGNVGVGTSSPNASDWNASSRLLHLYQNSTNGSLLKLESSNAAGIVGVGNDRMQLGTSTNDPLVFHTNVLERMRITSGGAVLIGQTSELANQGILQVSNSQTGGPAQYSARNTAYSSGNYNYSFGMNSNGDFVVYINPAVSGNIGVYLSAGATSWTANSDERLKDITGTIDNAIDSVNQIRPVFYTLKADTQEEKTKRVGLIAQDVQKVLPEAISENESGYLGVRYTEIIPLLTKAIQEQQEIINDLKERIETLENK